MSLETLSVEMWSSTDYTHDMKQSRQCCYMHTKFCTPSLPITRLLRFLAAQSCPPTTLFVPHNQPPPSVASHKHALSVHTFCNPYGNKRTPSCDTVLHDCFQQVQTGQLSMCPPPGPARSVATCMATMTCSWHSPTFCPHYYRLCPSHHT